MISGFHYVLMLYMKIMQAMDLYNKIAGSNRDEQKRNNTMDGSLHILTAYSVLFQSSLHSFFMGLTYTIKLS